MFYIRNTTFLFLCFFLFAYPKLTFDMIRSAFERNSWNVTVEIASLLDVIVVPFPSSKGFVFWGKGCLYFLSINSGYRKKKQKLRACLKICVMIKGNNLSSGVSCFRVWSFFFRECYTWLLWTRLYRIICSSIVNIYLLLFWLQLVWSFFKVIAFIYYHFIVWKIEIIIFKSWNRNRINKKLK